VPADHLEKRSEEITTSAQSATSHFRIDARARLAQLLDDDQYEVFDSNLVSTDPLKFVDLKAYSSRLKQAKKDTGLKDAIINAQGRLNGRPVIVSAMEYSFIGGSMGAVVGEVITRASRRLPRRVRRSSSFRLRRSSHDGRGDQPDATRQDSAALARLDTARVPYISVLTDQLPGERPHHSRCWEI